jgi:cleavage stimulation factor subunit 3
MGDLFRLSVEDLINCFPTSIQHWRELIQFEIKMGKIEQAKELFRRALSMPILFVPLWQDYISFIRIIHRVKEAQVQTELKKAFEFTLNKIGQDINSGPLWVEYLNMLMIEKRDLNRKTSVETNISTTFILSNLRNCLTSPHSGLEESMRLCQELATQFDTLSLDPDLISKYNVAREQYEKRRFTYASANLEVMATPIHINQPENQNQYAIWRNIIEYERSNPQHLTSNELATRVHLAFEQALIPLYRQSDLWLTYAQHVSSSVSDLNGNRAAIQVIERAKEACPQNSAVHFMQIELLERVGDKKEAKEMYERLCTAMESGDDVFGRAQGSLIWIHYMHFLRRLEEPIKSRELFLRAKKWKGCTWQVYVASALMEWRSNEMGDSTLKMVKKIFDKGLEKFSLEPGYVEAYSSWLLGIGDENEVRHLFEKILDRPVPDKNINGLWELFLNFEASRGDLGASQTIERRMIDVFAQNDFNIDIEMLRTRIFFRRYRLCGIPPCHDLELQYIAKHLDDKL